MPITLLSIPLIVLARARPKRELFIGRLSQKSPDRKMMSDQMFPSPLLLSSHAEKLTLDVTFSPHKIWNKANLGRTNLIYTSVRMEDGRWLPISSNQSSLFGCQSIGD